MIKSVLQQAEMKGMMKSKIEIISNAIKLGILDNDIISKLVNLPLEEIIRIRKELKLESKLIQIAPFALKIDYIT